MTCRHTNMTRQLKNLTSQHKYLTSGGRTMPAYMPDAQFVIYKELK